MFVMRGNQEVIRSEHSCFSWVESLTQYCSWLKYQEQPGKKSVCHCWGKIRYFFPKHFVLLQRAGVALNVLCGSTAGSEVDLRNFEKVSFYW